MQKVITGPLQGLGVAQTSKSNAFRGIDAPASRFGGPCGSRTPRGGKKAKNEATKPFRMNETAKKRSQNKAETKPNEGLTKPEQSQTTPPNKPHDRRLTVAHRIQ
jgi:hypothetical protein